MKKFTYNIDYSHLKQELGIENLPYSFENNNKEYSFNKIKELADNLEMELSDEEFMLLYKIQLDDKDAGWIMRIMKNYNKSLASALVSYICY